MPGHRQLVAGGAAGPPGVGHVDHPGRLRRGDAAEPRVTRRGRAVRHARGAAPRPRRPRDRPGAGHRPADRRAPCAAPGGPSPRTSSRSSSWSCSATSRPLPRGPPVPAHHRRARASATQPAIWLLGSSDYSASVAGVLGLPFSFAHHFAAAGHRRRRGRLPRGVPAVGGPRRALRDARRHGGVRRRPTSGPSGCQARTGCRSCACAPAGPGASPRPRRRRRTSTRRWRRRPPGRGPGRTSSAARSGCARSCSSWPTAPAPTS